MKHASAMRDKGGRYVFLIESCHQRSVVAGRCGPYCFYSRAYWFLNCLPGLSRRMRSRCRQALSSLVLLLFSTRPGRDRQSATSGAMNLRHVGEAFLVQVRQQAEKLVREMAA
ncbi:hypothetical protein HTZ85_10665 [Escherichia coli]|nr:hypothetical protein [Escherichia coli]